MTQHQKGNDKAVAIIGLSVRLPGSSTPDSFWRNLVAEKNLITEVPSVRWDVEKYYGDPVQEANKSDSKWGGFVDDIDCFDHKFFNISPREAEFMDPQQRIALELAWSAVEDSGHRVKELSESRTGVFIGASTFDYAEMIESTVETISGHGPTGNSFSIIPNRISYFMNFNGPSVCVDAACASSLVAIHQAASSVRQGESDYALAGGVNFCWSPKRFVALSQSGMLSKVGMSQAFDANADGYVRGEGGGLVLLKELDHAIEDGDLIYGVIKGSGVNHGGKTNSLTITNPVAQAALIHDVYTRAGIDPTTVSYIETHGPGTPFGDPIEIHGLKVAFDRMAKSRRIALEENTCALGSVKTNIGHLEAAAGIAGVAKVLLSLKHRKLVSNLNFSRLNPMITLRDSPFYVLDETRAWKRGSPGVSRRAGVSSFGFGGSNSHLVIEEYQPASRSVPECSTPRLLPVYAKSTEQLHAVLASLLDFVRGYIGVEQASIDTLAYSLQAGREPMECGVLVLAETLEQFADKVDQFLLGREVQKELWLVSSDNNKSHNIDIEQQAVNDVVLNANMNQDWSTIAQLWMEGAEIDWLLLYENVPGKTRLPTYPFSRTRHWFPVPEMNKCDDGMNAYLHPLLHQNISSLSSQVFVSRFSGDEFILANHKVNKKKIFPGVAYLEMVNAAVKLSLESEQLYGRNISIQNVFWLQPLTVKKNGKEVFLEFQRTGDDFLIFEIFTKKESEKIIHCQGNVNLQEIRVEPEHFDLSDYQNMTFQKDVNSEDCYRYFSSVGIDYGPSFQLIESLSVTDEFVLGRVRFPEKLIDNGFERYELHPSLMDAALQCWIGHSVEEYKDEPDDPSLPFSLDHLQSYAPLSPYMWVCLQRVDSVGENDEFNKLDITLYNDNGDRCVELKGFSSRKLKRNSSSSLPDSVENSEHSIVSILPRWTEIHNFSNKDRSIEDSRPVIIGGTKKERNNITKVFPDAVFLSLSETSSVSAIKREFGDIDQIKTLVWLVSNDKKKKITDESFIRNQRLGVIFGFRLIKAFQKSGLDVKPVTWVVVTKNTVSVRDFDRSNPTHTSVHGLLGSFAKETVNWYIAVYDIESSSEFASSYNWLDNLPVINSGMVVAYRRNKWYQQILVPAIIKTDTNELYKTRGVYVVIGGAGGVGRAWSEMMIRQFDARVVWIGRREINDLIKENIDSLGLLGTKPVYISADATDRRSLQKAYNQITGEFGSINGVVHSALLLADKSLQNMQERKFRSVLESKVDICVRIAQIFKFSELDFVFFFSSMASFIKSPGQANYTAGCVFKDAFAMQLGREWKTCVKVVNWGYWGSVGIVASKEIEERMRVQGVGSIESDEGIKCLSTVLKTSQRQIGLIKVDDSFKFEGFDKSLSIRVVPGTMRVNFRSFRQTAKRASEASNLLNGLHVWQDKLDNLITEALYAYLHEFYPNNLHRSGSSSFLGNNDQIHNPFSHTSLNDRWYEQTLVYLEKAGYIEYKDGIIKFAMDSRGVDLCLKDLKLFTETVLKPIQQHAHGELALAALEGLRGIYNEVSKSTDILFPEGSVHLVEQTYKNNPASDYYNELLADLVEYWISEAIMHGQDRKVRILEIGAGTGGTSQSILSRPMLHDDYIEEYCYSDVSNAFLLHGERKYSEQNKYLTFKLVNAEESLEAQGIETGSFDAVIATNVLHATQDIGKTLSNIKTALSENGILFLNEMNESRVFHHATFGLLDGWWMYSDAENRIDGSPALTSSSWGRVLKRSWLEPLLISEDICDVNSQQIIVSRSDGCIFRDQLTKSDPEDNSAISATSVSAEHFRVSNVTTGLNKSSDLKLKSLAYFKRLVGDVLKVTVTELDSSEPLDKYGIDSILVIQLTNEIRKFLPDVSSTFLFEHKSVDEIVNYFVSNHPEILADHLNLSSDISGTEDTSAGAVNGFVATSVSGNQSIPWKHDRANFSKIHYSESNRRPADIAIIGLSGRYPGSSNIQQYWEHLKNGKNCVSEIPKDRWDWRHYFSERKGQWGSIYTKWGGFLDEIDKFDPLFFNISPKEALRMDPQERLLLEESYRCLEDAGYTPESISESRKVGVFVGVMNGTYVPKSTYWSIANRNSYYFNFQGPSMAVDTACSASLTALHLAAESIVSGNCESALVGGVNLIIDPVQYFELTSISAISQGNKNRSFGKGADGFVDGEGVGVALLKPISDAVDDGDHIYGVIKGSMINAGGRTNGYTVPNPVAQTEVVRGAISKADISPKSVSYIEAHGTGTILGDPIEITALSEAYDSGVDDKQYCAIGSVKSNIGHLESAAGIAGLTKVLLQFQYGKIVPSLHSTELNPNIRFEESPFYVQQALTEWESSSENIDGQMKSMPRRAGVSSFGAGGANAHVILEEYVNSTSRWTEDANNGVFPIVLSAKTREQLKDRAELLLSWIIKNSDVNLTNIAYTLQVGREGMEERMGFSVKSISDLENKLRKYCESGQPGEDVFVGSTEGKQSIILPFSTDEELKKVVGKWIEKGKINILLQYWVQGMELNWSSLYVGNKPTRISLPTYPFAKERYWAPELNSIGYKSNNSGFVHPLVHKNVSDFNQIKYESDFSLQQQIWDTDAIEAGRLQLLPSVQLEMVSAAVTDAMKWNADDTVLRCRNVNFLYPDGLEQVSEHTITVSVVLNYETDSTVRFELFGSEKEKPDSLWSHGYLSSDDSNLDEYYDGALRDNPVDNIISDNGMDPCKYDLNTNMFHGIEIETAGVSDIHIGDFSLLFHVEDLFYEGEDSARISASMFDVLNAYCKYFSGSTENRSSIWNLVHIDELTVVGSVSNARWISIQPENVQDTEQSIYDISEILIGIDYYDENQDVVATISGLRATPGFPNSDGISRQNVERESRYLVRTWQQSEDTDTLDNVGNTVIFCGEKTKTLIPILDENIMGDIFVFNIDEPQNIPDVSDFDWNKVSGCIDLLGCEDGDSDITHLAWLQDVIKKNQNREIRLLYVTLGLESFRNSTQRLSGATLVGFYRMLQSEYSYVSSRHMDGDMAWDQTELCTYITKEYMQELQGYSVCFRDGNRYIAGLGEIDLPVVEDGKQYQFNEDQILLITGGTGGIGRLCAQYFIEEYSVKNIVLTGRVQIPDREQWSDIDRDNTTISEKIELVRTLESAGARVKILATDLNEKQAVQAMVSEIENDMGSIAGVLHCAGIADYDFPAFIRKPLDTIQTVLSAKTTGLDNIYSCIDKSKLQFFVSFSSVSSTVPSLAVGSSDYAAANTYMDYHAEAHRSEVPIVSIQWPSWKNAGMTEITSAAYKATGLLSHSNAEGLSLLQHVLNNNTHPVILPAIVNPSIWDTDKLSHSKINFPDSQSIPHSTESNSFSDSHENKRSILYEHTLDWLVTLFARELQLDKSRINVNKPLQSYGVDSIVLVQIITTMGKRLQDDSIDPTVFLEHSSLDRLSVYLIGKYEASLIQLFKPDDFSNVRNTVSDKQTMSNVPSKITNLNGNVRSSFESVIDWLTNVFSNELQIDKNRINPDKPIQKYGVDSILLAQILVVLGKELGGVSLDPAVIIENPDINSLARYLQKEYKSEVTSIVNKRSGTYPGTQHLRTNKVSPSENRPESKNKIAVTSAPKENKKIAVVGMASHFPEAGDIAAYWENLRMGKDSTKVVPSSRWDTERYYHADEFVQGKSISKWGAFLDDIEMFDARYFDIPESWASQVDPLERQWMEVSVEALTDSGISKETLWGRQVGVFAGARTGQFLNKIVNPNKDVIIGTGQNFITAHLAHLYNFKGPNMVVDTACSSSLSAIHLAVQSLQRGESEYALAGGVDILLDETVYLMLSAAQVLSPDGRCKTFDSSANGIGIGEGCGVLILQTLDDAIKEGRKIYGVIDGSAVNNDGNTMGITTPNPEAQQELLEQAIKTADIPVESISYIETHGTGTLIGDPIELRALTRVFEKATSEKGICGVGSVKSNIGHLLSAAGVAGVIKTLLCLTQKQLVSTLHCNQPNPRFSFSESPLYIARNQNWKPVNGVRRAGISAFGLGGNNSHIIVSDEGIPEKNKASMIPVGEKVIFNRKRYWPSDFSSKNDANINRTNLEREEEEFEEFFDAEVLVGNN